MECIPASKGVLVVDGGLRRLRCGLRRHGSAHRDRRIWGEVLNYWRPCRVNARGPTEVARGDVGAEALNAHRLAPRKQASGARIAASSTPLSLRFDSVAPAGDSVTGCEPDQFIFWKNALLRLLARANRLRNAPGIGSQGPRSGREVGRSIGPRRYPGGPGSSGPVHAIAARSESRTGERNGSPAAHRASSSKAHDPSR